MTISRTAFAFVVLATFLVGVWGFREAGVWKERARQLPFREVTPPASEPAPGGLPM